MSTRIEMVAMVRKLIADEQAVGYTEGGNLELPEGTQELENYLDRAVDTYSKHRAAAGSIKFIKKMVVVNGSSLPADFLRFAGSVPISIDGGVMNWYGAASDLPVRYFARLPYVTSYGDTDTLPYDHDVYMSLCALAAIYALNKHEFTVSQDLQLLALGGDINASSQ